MTQPQLKEWQSAPPLTQPHLQCLFRIP